MSILHVCKSAVLFVVGVLLKNVVFPPSGAIPDYLVTVAYYLLLILLVHKYVFSYRNPRLPENDFNVCIIGAGFCGLGMAIKLKEIGVKFRIIEKDKELGGTWWQNQYPGCGCDVHSHLYSFSFEPNPHWSKAFSEREEIHQYQKNLSEKYGITQHIEFQKKVESTVWNEQDSEWIVTLDNGETFRTNIVIVAVGQLAIPRTPRFEGKDTFQGEAFHSAEWQKGYDPTGRTVAVIGTGASAVQIVPTIAPKVKHLYVFQRTPCWSSPKDTTVYPGWLKTLLALYPPLLYLYRMYHYWLREVIHLAGFRVDSPVRGMLVKQIAAEMRRSVKDPALAERLVPRYDLGCKRVTPSSAYLQTFNRDNVSLITDPIKRFTKDGIETADGSEHKVDTIVYATGFYPEKSYHTFKAVGLSPSGKGGGDSGSRGSLQEEWGDSPRAYLGLAHPGYPNMFFLYGPGSNLGHHSVIFMFECQFTYILDAISKMVRHRIKSIDVKRDVHNAYQEWAQKCMQNKAFNSPTCSSWYRDSQGVNYALYPNTVTQYWWKTRKADLTKYNCKAQ